MDSETAPRLRRVRRMVMIVIVGLIISGATAIPVTWELKILLKFLPPNSDNAVVLWLQRVYQALLVTDRSYPFLAYGYDWLAFGHFVIAYAFVGAWRDPVRNIWLFEFGMAACVAVIPYTLIFGYLREIPFTWRLVDCSFGVFGFVPLWYARRLTRDLDSL